MTCRRAIWLLIGVSALLRLAFAASVGSFTNEPYYFLYARHLDWGFFDHPPMVGIVSAVGLKLVGSFAPALGLRLGFIILFAGSSWLLARITSRFYGDRSAFMAVLALNMTIFYGLKIGTLSEPDGPLLFFWLLTLDRLSIALRSGSRLSWIAVGAAWGGAMMSKYHAVLLPAGFFLYLIAWKPARRVLLTPGPYIAAVTGLLVFSPVIFWNASHQWISFLYQGNRAGGFHGFQVDMFLEALAGQILYLTPWVWLGVVAVLVRLLRNGPRDWSEPEAFLIAQTLPALGLFMSVATFQRIMPHWPIIGFVALFPLLGRKMCGRWIEFPRLSRIAIPTMAAVPIVLGLLTIAQARWGLFQDGRGNLLGCIKPIEDPTLDTIRWGQVAQELGRRGLLDDPNCFLFTDHWRFSAELAMATDREAKVACLNRDARSFTFWSSPDDWVGKDGIYVRIEESTTEPRVYQPWFTRIEPLASIPIVRRGTPLETIRLYRCVRQTDPYLFGYNGKGPIPRPGKGLDQARVSMRGLWPSPTIR